MMVWNVAAILDLAGGAQNLRKLLARHGQDVPDSGAISMWKSRNRLPSGWSAQVLYVLAVQHRTVDLRTLLVDEPDADQADTDDADLFASD
jgi:hypothetical protein